MELIEVKNPESIRLNKSVEYNTFYYQGEIYVKGEGFTPIIYVSLNGNVIMEFDLESDMIPVKITGIHYYR